MPHAMFTGHEWPDWEYLGRQILKPSGLSMSLERQGGSRASEGVSSPWYGIIAAESLARGKPNAGRMEDMIL